MKDEVTLSADQAALCRAVLSQDLVKISRLLNSGKDASGNPLEASGERALINLSARLQLTLMALGMSSEEMAGIITPGDSDLQE